MDWIFVVLVFWGKWISKDVFFFVRLVVMVIKKVNMISIILSMGVIFSFGNLFWFCWCLNFIVLGLIYELLKGFDCCLFLLFGLINYLFDDSLIVCLLLILFYFGDGLLKRWRLLLIIYFFWWYCFLVKCYFDDLNLYLN